MASRRVLAAGWLAAGLLSACGAAGPSASDGALRVYAISATATVQPSPTSAPAAPPPTATALPGPTPTLAPVAVTLDFATERRDDVTVHVGQAIQLRLNAGPSSDWLSGVDDARVLRPMAPDGSGIYQAMTPGTALLTAHYPQGCANVIPGVPCRNPEHGLWFQTRVYVLA